MRSLKYFCRIAVAVPLIAICSLSAKAEKSLPPIIAIAGGGNAFLRADGSVWSFTNPQYLTRPVKVPGLKDVVGIGVGDGLTAYALRRDGSVWSWTARCQSPDEDGIVCRYRQAKQVSGIAQVIQISVGRAFAIALKRDGTVWGWGDNTVGELGDTAEQLNIGLGQRNDLLKHRRVTVSKPVQIPVVKDIVGISAGLDHAAAVDRAGQVWTWGCNASDGPPPVGTLGEGEFVSQAGVGVVKLKDLPPSSKVAVGSSRMALVGRDGKVRAWGVYRDSIVQYGDMKVSEVAGPDKPRIVAIGDGAILWVGSDGVAWQMGPGMFGYDKDDPGKTIKIGVDYPVSDISTGAFMASVLTTNGQIWTWGNPFGRPARPVLVMER